MSCIPVPLVPVSVRWLPPPPRWPWRVDGVALTPTPLGREDAAGRVRYDLHMTQNVPLGTVALVVATVWRTGGKITGVTYASAERRVVVTGDPADVVPLEVEGAALEVHGGTAAPRPPWLWVQTEAHAADELERPSPAAPDPAPGRSRTRSRAKARGAPDPVWAPSGWRETPAGRELVAAYAAFWRWPRIRRAVGVSAEGTFYVTTCAEEPAGYESASLRLRAVPSVGGKISPCDYPRLPLEEQTTLTVEFGDPDPDLAPYLHLLRRRNDLRKEEKVEHGQAEGR